MTPFGASNELVVEVFCYRPLGRMVFPAIDPKTERRVCNLELRASRTYQHVHAISESICVTGRGLERTIAQGYAMPMAESSRVFAAKVSRGEPGRYYTRSRFSRFDA